MTAKDKRQGNGLGYWIPAFLWMGVIYLLSDQPHSGDITEKYLGDWNIPIRKLAHMSEYAILFCLFRTALKADKPASKDRSGGQDRQARSNPGLGPGPAALILSVVYAAGDEWHQAYVPGRSANFQDDLWDGAGAGMGWAAYHLVSLIRNCPTSGAKSR